MLPLDAIQDDIEAHNINIDQKCNKYNGCIAQDGILVQQGDIIAYKGYDDQVLVPCLIYYIIYFFISVYTIKNRNLTIIFSLILKLKNDLF